MKVYIIINYQDYKWMYNEALFDSREKAEQYLKDIREEEKEEYINIEKVGNYDNRCIEVEEVK